MEGGSLHREEVHMYQPHRRIASRNLAITRRERDVRTCLAGSDAVVRSLPAGTCWRTVLACRNGLPYCITNLVEHPGGHDTTSQFSVLSIPRTQIAKMPMLCVDTLPRADPFCSSSALLALIGHRRLRQTAAHDHLLESTPAQTRTVRPAQESKVELIRQEEEILARDTQS